MTFALFLYESPSDVVWGLDYRLVGFDAGDGGNYTSILDIMEFTLNIQESNIYRIDGEIFVCIPTKLNLFLVLYRVLNKKKLGVRRLY